ncbi:hypothetical protein ATI61_102349 [Archangium gephyra]|uniref:Uncharacterized protein n=1 Tax=Archangium gephyra TaxID=48 RepID=A0AAC8QCN8_9BACT|nr:hypothetical protein [Archangium gephyra]AKJ05287.1 Hypothetical protein AA314_06913 [Archangium gephyra]REG35975.1 hypothetical protein ATI61_102349 [Archangium gephyra]
MNVALLKIYLNDHLAGSILGLELARRAKAENADNAVGEYLETFERELLEDRSILQSVMSALGFKRDVLKQGMAWVGEKLGRLKLNGQLTGYSPLSRVVELEGLCLGTEGRLSMWRTLRRLSRKDERLGRFDFSSLIARAEHQRRTLERLRQQSSDEAFFEPGEGSVLRLTPSPSEREAH